MKKSFSTLLGQVTDVLNPQPDDEDEEAMVIQGSQPVSLSPFQVLDFLALIFIFSLSQISNRTQILTMSVRKM